MLVIRAWGVLVILRSQLPILRSQLPAMIESVSLLKRNAQTHNLKPTIGSKTKCHFKAQTYNNHSPVAYMKIKHLLNTEPTNYILITQTSRKN